MKRVSLVGIVVVTMVAGAGHLHAQQPIARDSISREQMPGAVAGTTIRIPATGLPDPVAGQRAAIPVTQLAQQQARNIRLTFQLIEADGFQEADPAIAEIVAELRTLFRFEGYRLLDTSLLTGVISGSDDPVHATSVVRQRLALGERGVFDLEAYIERAASANTARIHVELKDAYGEVSVLETSVNIRDGQTIVLGSGRPGTLPDSSAGTTALILAMSADIEPYD